MLAVTQVLLSRLLEVHLLITGMIVVAIVLLMPNGIIGTLRSRWHRRTSKAPSAAPAGESP
jgi:ABC-type branched-subunit amino acid transport system permease subunit